MSWFTEFENRLNNYKRGSAPNLDFASVAGFDSNTLGLYDQPEGVGERLMDIGGRALDVLSRPGYAVGGFLNDILDDSVNGQDDENPFEAAWQGLSGKRKEFFQPWQIIDPHQEGDSGLENAGRFVTDFLASVFTDPLSLVPGTAAVKGARAVGKVTGASKALEKAASFARPVLETERIPDAITDASRLIDSKPAQVAPFIDNVLGSDQPAAFAAPEAAAQAPNFINKTVGTSPLAPVDVPAVQSALKQAPYAPDEASTNLIKHLLTGGKANAVNGTDLAGRLFAAQSVRTGLTEALQAIKGRLFRNGELENPWRDVQVAKGAGRPEPVKPEFDELIEPTATQPTNVPGKIDQNTIVRSMIDASVESGAEKEMLKLSKLKGNEKNIYYADDTDKIVKGGAAVSPYKIAEKYAGKPMSEFQKRNPSARVSFIDDSTGKEVYVSPSIYTKMLKGEFPLKDLQGKSIAKNGELIPAEEYFQTRRQKWTQAGIDPEEMAAYEAEKARRADAMTKYQEDFNAYKDEELGLVTKREKPDKDARISWLQKYGDKLTEKDIAGLRSMMQLGNEKGFLNKVDEIMTREGNLDLETIDALQDAVKSGRVPMDVAQEFFGTFGVRTFGEAKKRLAAIDSQIERLRNQGADLAGGPQTNAPNFAGASPIPAPTIKPLEISKFKAGTPVGRETAKTIVKDASTIDPNTLSPEILDITIESLKKAMQQEFQKARQVMKYPRKSKGAKGDTPTPYAGGARYLEEYNLWSQITHWKALQGSIAKHIPKTEEGKSIVGYQRGKYMYDRMMPSLKAADDVLRSYGIQPSAVPGGKGIPLSIYDILSGLPEDWVIKHIFNIGRRDATDLTMSTGRQVTLTQLFNIAEQAVRETPGELLDYNRMLLRGGLDFPVTVNGDEVDRIVNSAFGYSQAKGAAARSRAEKNFQKKNPDVLPENADIVSFNKQGISTAERILNETLDPISSKEFIDHITTRLEQNRKSAGLQADTFVKKAEYAAVSKFIDDVSNASTQSEVFSLIENARKGVPGFVRDTTDIVPPPGGVDAVADSVGLAGSTSATTEIAQKARQAFASARNSDELASVATKVDDSIDDIVSKMVDDGTIPMVKGLGDPAVYRKIRQWDVGPVARAIAAYFPHLGEGPLRQVWLASQNSATFIANHFAKQLSKFQREIGTTDDAARIFNGLKNDTLMNTSDAPFAAQMKKIIDTIFDTENGKFGFMERNGIEPQHVNSHLKHFGIDPKEFGLNGRTREEAYQSWREWPDVKDPLDFLSKYFQAVNRAYSERAFGSSISQRFGFKEHQPGFVKIPKNTTGSRIAHLIDKDLWFPQEVVENMKALDKTLFDAAQPPKNNAFGRIFDSLTHKYKTGLTIYRPGHHLRNMYGDIWLNYMDGIRSPKYYNQAHKVLASRKNYYDDLVLDTRVSDLGYSPKSTAITMKTRGGKEIPLTYDDIYKLSISQGILHDYSTIEDLGMLTAKQDADAIKGGRSITRPFNGKLHEKMAGVSEYRDHYVRMAHLMGLMEKDKNNFQLLKALPGEHPEATLRRSLELRFQDYSARIRKWHPDGSDLTLWEKRVMRRGILFYSWIRKAVPLVIESMLTRPGRFLTFPKAMYNLAEANGIDLNGFTDPFPADQMFPAWMGALQGPQFGGIGQGYMGLRPGVPGLDILDSYFSSPGEGFKTALQGLHPLFKVPVELAMQKNMQGVPIKDFPSYALGQVPFGNLANTTAGWLNGGDKPIGSTAPSNEVYDSLSSGFKDPAAIAWINFLTGAGLIDMSKPSYQKAAEFDTKYGRLGTP